MKNIIDIRSIKNYNKSHIDGAIHIDQYELVFNPGKYLKKDEIYYIYCNSGVSSKVVVNRLNSFGYHTVNIDGGYNNYLLRK